LWGADAAGTSLGNLLASLRTGSSYDLGRQGEDVARYALWRAPATRDGLDAVLRWADWVREWNITHHDRLEQVADRGIDLVATYSDGRRTAVQVKLRTGGSPMAVGWEELATFAAKSATEPFTDRLLILLGDATLSGNARAELARQHALKPLTVWAATEIETHGGDDWPADHASLVAALGAAPPPTVEPRGLHGYQRDAVRDVHASFSGGVERAQLLMACGTGKTITTHGVATQLPAGRLMVLAPSLSLLRQLIREYRWQYGGRIDAIAVCSDATVGITGPGEDADEPVITAGELGVPTRTEPAAIADFLDAAPEDRPRVVFATYQSSPRVAEAQQLTGAVFDLVVADEAHYLAGRPSPAFATVLDGTRIRATRRLFTTATPRLVAPHLKASDPEVWASMDDSAVFGPVAHRLPFGAAIDAGLLADYRLLVLGADERAAAAVDKRILVDAGITTDARTLAAALAVLRLARDHGRRRIVTFHSRTAWAQVFAALLEAHHKWAPPELHVDLAAEAVTGDQPSDVRAAALTPGTERGRRSAAWPGRRPRS
jgi:predicted helicase